MYTHKPAPQFVRGRLAPSPTGFLHLGNVWSFMHAWLSVRSKHGTLILRMEDIDPQRSKSAFADAAMEDLAWLGINWDEGPFFQSGRMALYTEAIRKLSNSGLVYRCYCTRKEVRALAGAPHAGECGSPYPGTCRNLTAEQRKNMETMGRHWALRVRYPEQDKGFYDMALSGRGEPLPEGLARLPGCRRDAQGRLIFSPEAAGGDFAICRSDGVVAYTLAVVVDDMDMEISEVVRGDDLLAATPRQVVLHEFLGNKAIPEFGHVPLVLDAKGERLAKRHNGLQVRALRNAGVRAEAVIGYFAWQAGLIDGPRPVRIAELVPGYSLRRISRRSPVLPDAIQDMLAAMGN